MVHDPVNDVIYVTGRKFNTTDYTQSDAVILQTDLGGRRLWTQVFGPSDRIGYGQAYRVILDPSSSGILVCGVIYQNSQAVVDQNPDMFLARYSFTGALVHSRIFGGAGYDFAFDILPQWSSPYILLLATENGTQAIYEFKQQDLEYRSSVFLNSGELASGQLHPTIADTLYVTGSTVHNSTTKAYQAYLKIIRNDPLEILTVRSYIFPSCKGFGRNIRFGASYNLTVTAAVCSDNTALFIWHYHSSDLIYPYLLGYQLTDVEIFDDTVDPYVVTTASGPELILTTSVIGNSFGRSFNYVLGSQKVYIDLTMDKTTGKGYGLFYYPLGFKELFANVTRPPQSIQTTTPQILTTTSSITTTSNVMTTTTTGSPVQIISTTTTVSMNGLPTVKASVNQLSTPFISTEMLIFIVLGLVTVLVITSFLYAVYLTCYRKPASVGVTDFTSPIPSRPRAFANPKDTGSYNFGTTSQTTSFFDNSVTLGGVERAKSSVSSSVGHQIFVNTDFMIDKPLYYGEDGLYIAITQAQSLKYHGDYVMIKTYQTLPDRNYDETFFAFQRELFMLQSLGGDKKNIVEILGYSMMEPPSILLKHYPRGTLKSWISSGTEVKSKGLVFHFIKDVAYGTKSIHSVGIAHCNLNLDSVLIDQDEYGQLRCMISNFTCAETLQTLKRYPRYLAANIMFTAPETFAYFQQSKATGRIQFSLLLKRDVYSLAIMICSLLSLERNLSLSK